MDVKTVIEKMHRNYAGDTKYPTEGDSDWNKYLSILNDIVRDYSTDPILQPDGRFEANFEIGTVSDTTVLSYDLDKYINDLANYVYVTDTGGQKHRYKVIKAAYRTDLSQVVYISGQNPKTITFSELSPDSLDATITADVYITFKELTKGTEKVPVDRPLYVVYQGAAMLCADDPSKVQKIDDLQDKADQQWDKMQDAADAGPVGSDTSVPTYGYNDFNNDLEVM